MSSAIERARTVCSVTVSRPLVAAAQKAWVKACSHGARHVAPWQSARRAWDRLRLHDTWNESVRPDVACERNGDSDRARRLRDRLR